MSGLIQMIGQKHPVFFLAVAGNAPDIHALGNAPGHAHSGGVFTQTTVRHEHHPEPVSVVLVIPGLAPEHDGNGAKMLGRIGKDRIRAHPFRAIFNAA